MLFNVDIAGNHFHYVYPLIAEQIKDKFGITQGKCTDIVSGPATLPIALARITDLEVFAVDQSPHCKIVAGRNAKEAGLSDRIIPVVGPAEDLPFEDDSIDLIISRNSIMFWPDLVTPFDEILRVLKPGGKTYIGVRFGSSEIKKRILEKMEARQPGRNKERKERMGHESQNRIKNALEKSAVSQFDMHQTETGLWICISKE